MQILIAVGILILVYVIIILEKKISSKRIRIKIKEEFGKKPETRKCSFEKIEYHWKEYTKTIPDDEKIDDITWNDLDMNNVYCRINNCSSFVGEQILYSKLHCLPKNDLYRELLEKKISFFAFNDREREQTQFLLSSLGKDDRDFYLPRFIANLDTYRISGIWRYQTMRLLQILLGLSLLLAVISQELIFLFLLGGIFLNNLVIYAIGKNKFEVNLDMVDSIIGVIGVGNTIANTKKLSYENRFSDLMKVVIPFKSLWNSMSIVQIRKNAVYSGDIVAIIYDYIIGATLWDFVKYDQMISKLMSNQNEFMELYQVIGEIDTAISIASFRESLPLFCRPSFSKENVLKMKQIFHPLIDEPVCNTIELDNSCIITGSNASGKSTYIKAVAINVILGQNIHTCMADEITLPYAKVITSMAVRDDLMAKESYYIKEIKYLKRIVENLSEERLVICIIDEILRGTNTEERIAASASILKYLHNKNCISIVASHDIELTEVLDDLYDNYYFTEQMEDKDIIFDYKIYRGVSNSKNAIKLLHHERFPYEIIEEAQKNVHMRSIK
ncbi:MutS-related protein [Gudongella sp. DL1XJH-153]|uniref:MutS-related protein n=1 Tax=Gudongella sp. DL1XJH-153 TaxID=3409804 RepID=UPI003BB7FFE0